LMSLGNAFMAAADGKDMAIEGSRNSDKSRSLSNIETLYRQYSTEMLKTSF